MLRPDRTAVGSSAVPGIRFLHPLAMKMAVHILFKSIQSLRKILALIALEKSVAGLGNRGENLRKCQLENAAVIPGDFDLEAEHVEEP